MSTVPTWNTLTLDESLALRTAATRPRGRIRGCLRGGDNREVPAFLVRPVRRPGHRDRAVVWSGGSEPSIEVNAAAVAAMAERGIDISGDFPKPWTDETVRSADLVITMGRGDA